jgi:F0F1-type ATP synthase assembly protein I
MKQLSTAIISGTLLVAFLIPYIWKLKDLGLMVVLTIGVFLVVFDFYNSIRQKPNRKPEQAFYDSEST